MLFSLRPNTVLSPKYCLVKMAPFLKCFSKPSNESDGFHHLFGGHHVEFDDALSICDSEVCQNQRSFSLLHNFLLLLTTTTGNHVITKDFVEAPSPIWWYLFDLWSSIRCVFDRGLPYWPRKFSTPSHIFQLCFRIFIFYRPTPIPFFWSFNSVVQHFQHQFHF